MSDGEVLTIFIHDNKYPLQVEQGWLSDRPCSASDCLASLVVFCVLDILLSVQLGGLAAALHCEMLHYKVPIQINLEC